MNDLASIKLPQKKRILIKQTNKQTNFQLSTAREAWSYCPTLFQTSREWARKTLKFKLGEIFFPFDSERYKDNRKINKTW